MCDLTMYKIKKRTTQMAFRLTVSLFPFPLKYPFFDALACSTLTSYFFQEGKGEAFYEIGVHDNGEIVGIEYEEVIYTMVALFHMS